VAVPDCQGDEVEVTVRWERDGAGLRGQVLVRNVGGRTCRLPGKPGVRPLGQDGRPLEVNTSITLELLEPGYVDIAPGEQAAARVTWPNWCGPAAGDQAEVTWNDTPVTARVEGPVQPSCQPGRGGNLTSWWFLPDP
jgi:hypothetical protein